jgi:signal transduction histidine kinase/ActR/RegA family two-component response regulator
MQPLKQFLPKRHGASSYIIPVLLILCMFAAVIFVGVRQLTENETRLHEEALDNVELDAQMVSQQLNGLYVSLEATAPVLALENGFTRPQMLQALSSLREACNADFTVRTNPEGIAFNFQGKDNINLANRRYIHESLQGERSCEYVTAGIYDPSSAYLILSVPIRYGDKVVGVLHGSYKASNFDDLLSKLAAKTGNYGKDTFLLAADGKLVAASNRKADCKEFAQLLAQKMDGENGAPVLAAGNADTHTIKANLMAGNSGYLPLKVNGRLQYYYYAPLTEIKSCPWVMVTQVSEASLLARTRSVREGMLLLFVVAVCITAALIISVLRQQRLMVLQRENAEQLAQALAAARQANRAKSDFLSRMSHDMRTPLNGIIGMTYLARDLENPSGTKACLDKINISSKFLLGLINDVLDMAKVESGKLELHPEPYDLGQFLAYLEAVIKPLCAEKGIKLVFDLQPVKTRIPVLDKLRFNQMCFNLLSNAVKYTPEGGTVTLLIHDKMVTETRFAMDLEISDTGIGMSEEFQKTMFEPFTQENRNDVSQTRGTGLGLAIVKKIVDVMQGTITVRSKPGEGSTFQINLEVDSVPRETVAKVAAPAADYADLAGKHVLLCEDHPLNQEIAKALLQKKGLVVETAENGQVGREKFSASAPGYYDAILMDIRMPVLDGYEAAREIRALERPDAKSVPIIAMTAEAFADSIEKAKQAGMNDYITKPVEPEKLFRVLQKYMLGHFCLQL